ncbi:MAG: 50S ribosomal protein L21 [Bdellovibrionota bacterium]
MYAIFRTGGKQYTVKPGDLVYVEKLDNELGSEFDINEVLLIGGEKTHIGQPLVKNAKVTVVVTKQAKNRKVIVFKKKRRQSFRKFKTHRQPFTELFVKAITGPEGQVVKSEEKARVMDMAVIRAEKIQAKIDAKRERLDNRPADGSTEEIVKKVAKKAAPKKKVAKKAAGAKSSSKKTKKSGAKKVAKKTSKKS